MFDINDWANIKVYGDYIIPAVFIALIAIYYMYKGLVQWFKVKRMHHIHKNIFITSSSNMAWDKFRCEDCGKVVFETPSLTNSSFTRGVVHFNSNSFVKCEKPE